MLAQCECNGVWRAIHESQMVVDILGGGHAERWMLATQLNQRGIVVEYMLIGGFASPVELIDCIASFVAIIVAIFCA